MPIATTQETKAAVAASQREDANGEQHSGRPLGQNHVFALHYDRERTTKWTPGGRAVKTEVQCDVSGHRTQPYLTVATVSIGIPALLAAQALSRTSAKGQARNFRTEEQTGARLEIPVDLKKGLSGNLPDPRLHSRAILLVPNSAGGSALDRGLAAAFSIRLAGCSW